MPPPAVPQPDEPRKNAPQRIRGHQSDFDELSWHLTYRAAQAAKDETLPQSEAEAKFVDQMLGDEPIDARDFAFGNRLAPALSPPKPRKWPWVLVAFFLLPLVIALVSQHAGNMRAVPAPDPQNTSPSETAPDSPPTIGPNYSLAPYDRTANEVISEMLAIAQDANPGLIWFTSQQPELEPCELPNGHPGQIGRLNIRWGMGDYDAIRAAGSDGNAEWHSIQQANDAADDKMIEAWIGEPLTPATLERFPIDPLHGNWYFGYIFPGLASGESKFDLDDGVGILQLETLCLQPVSEESNRSGYSQPSLTAAKDELPLAGARSDS
jgi:hypothetical protein